MVKQQMSKQTTSPLTKGRTRKRSRCLKYGSIVSTDNYVLYSTSTIVTNTHRH